MKIKLRNVYQGVMPTKFEIKEFIGERILHRTKVALKNDSEAQDWPDPEYLPASHEDATLVTSLLPNGRHMPVIDIDRECMLIPSSTPGRFHLYINVEMDGSDYFEMLRAMKNAGVVQRGYYSHTLDRGRSFVRYPGVTKHNEQRKIEGDL